AASRWSIGFALHGPFSCIYNFCNCKQRTEPHGSSPHAVSEGMHQLPASPADAPRHPVLRRRNGQGGTQDHPVLAAVARAEARSGASRRAGAGDDDGRVHADPQPEAAARRRLGRGLGRVRRALARDGDHPGRTGPARGRAQRLAARPEGPRVASGPGPGPRPAHADRRIPGAARRAGRRRYRMNEPADGTGRAPAASSNPAPSGERLAIVLILLAAAGTFALTVGTRQTMGLFLSPLNSATGLGLGSISLAFAFGQLWWGLTQPFAGAIADRIGAGRVLFA